MKAVKWIGIAVGALVVIVLAAGAYLAATFDPNAYKPMLPENKKSNASNT